MKRILIPTSFSESSANSLQKAHALFVNSQLTLLHCYSPHAYNRRYDFGSKSYEKGIEGLLSDFYREHITEPATEIKLVTAAGNVSETITEISSQFDLMVMSKQPSKKATGYWLSEKVFYIASKGHCPVLLLPTADVLFDFKECKNIWHIKRKEVETAVLKKNLSKIDINPEAVKVKYLEQTTYKSALWKAISAYTKTHNKALLDDISAANETENIDLIILVSHGKDTFQKFMRAEVMQLINQFNIPILVFQVSA